MTCDLNIRTDGSEASVLYKIQPEMASGKSSYVHLVAGGYVSSKTVFFCCSYDLYNPTPLETRYRHSVVFVV